MFRNYLKIAFRNLWRHQGFSFINIAGLAIGMASAALILLWIRNETSYDQFHRNKADIYKAYNRGISDGKLDCWDGTPSPLGPALQQEYPDVLHAARTTTIWFVTSVGQKKISSQSMITDSSFLSIFSFPMLQGDSATALNRPNTVVVTAKMAKKMFGTTDVLNKTLRVDKSDFIITGVLKDLPPNSSFNFEYLLPWSYLRNIGQVEGKWGDNSYNTYVQLRPGSQALAVNAKIKDISRRHSHGEVKEEIFLYPLSQWHLYSRFENGLAAGGRIEMIRLFGIIASFILLIACINFMNLSTARSEQRAKEVGIRKVSGANRGLLITQFLGESVLIAFIAGILAFTLVQLCLPSFDLLTQKALVLPLSNVYFWISSIGFVVGSGLIAGIYPAFFISSFRPVAVLKGTFKRAHALVAPRKVLVVLQFSFAIILIICTFIVLQQLRYAQERETGYDRGQLAYHWSTGQLDKNYDPLKTELLASGLVVQMARSNTPLTETSDVTWDLVWKGKHTQDQTDFDIFSEDEGLIKTAGLKLLQGRDMDLGSYPTDSTAILLNESAVRTMGFANPIGQTVMHNKIDFHVIGVIRDFVLNSPYDPTRPLVIEGRKSGMFNVINMKLRPGRGTAKDLAVIGSLFKKYNPDYPFEYHFADQDYARKFEDNQRLATLTGLFAGLAILISCLGLFGLAAYMAENRIKEIGVRKVLGASVFSITTLLSKDFLTLVLLSILIASPIAWYAMHSWLAGYAYHVRIEWWVFVMAGGLSVVISLMTVSYQTIKAAIANPVKNLRTE